MNVDFENEKAKTSEMIRNLLTELSASKLNNEALENSHNQKIEELSQSYQNRLTLQEEVLSQNENFIVEIQKENSSLKGIIENDRKEISELIEKRNTSLSEISELLLKISVMNSQLETLLKEKDNLASQLDSLNVTYKKELDALNGLYQVEIEEKKKSLELVLTLNSKIEELLSEKYDLTKSNVGLNQVNSELQKKQTELFGKISNFETEIIVI